MKEEEESSNEVASRYNEGKGMATRLLEVLSAKGIPFSWGVLRLLGREIKKEDPIVFKGFVDGVMGSKDPSPKEK